jgi:hypothetical protein
MDTCVRVYVHGSNSIDIFRLPLHEALGLKACCGFSSLVLQSFSGSCMASYSLKVIVHYLSGNSVFSHSLYVFFPVLSVFIVIKLSTCSLFLIS